MRLKCHHLWHCWQGGATSSSSSSSSSTQFVDWPDRSGDLYHASCCHHDSPPDRLLQEATLGSGYLGHFILNEQLKDKLLTTWWCVCKYVTHTEREKLMQQIQRVVLHAPHLQRLKSPYKVQWNKIITIFQSQDLGFFSTLYSLNDAMWLESLDMVLVHIGPKLVCFYTVFNGKTN
jgi:hypothetical protein